MDKYAAVEFGAKEHVEQKRFLFAMCGVNIIQLSREDMIYQLGKLEEEKAGSLNRIVLHGEDDVKLFEHMMKVFFPEKEYKITDDPDDPEFDNWLSEKRLQRLTTA